MTLTIDIELSPEREKWAYLAWQNVLAVKETEATSLEVYLSAALKPVVDNLLIDITDSWKPQDSKEVKVRREEAIAHLKEIPVEKLELIEAAIAASKEP